MTWLTPKRALLLVLAMVAIATAIYPFVPVVGHAERMTPLKDYPLTNAGVCMMLADYHWDVDGASPDQVKELCARNGVEI